jgi:Uma2 family endonuclease
MATIPRQRRTREIVYPTGDGKPMAETELHLKDMIDTIQVLSDRFADRPDVYVCGNLLLYYEEGNPRKQISPDAFVVFGVPKEPNRDYYLVWKEGKAPDFVAEITSKSTKREDQKKKLEIYREILKVPEYVLFDPRAEYLKPPLQGFRLVGGDYTPIEPIDGRLPSQVLGLHLERDGQQLRLYDPATGTRLLTRLERQQAADHRAEEERRRAEEERHRAEEERRRAEEASCRAEAAEADQRRLAEENERLRREIEALKGR